MPTTSYGIDPGLSRLFPKKKKATWGTGGGNGPVTMEPSLDPGQTALAEQLQNMLSGAQSPQDYLSGLTQFTGAQDPFGGPGGSDVLAALQAAMSGKIDEAGFQSAIAAPMRQDWEQHGVPSTQAAFVGPGTFWGTAQAQAVQQGAAGVEQDIAGQRFDLQQTATQNALQAALGYGGMMSQNLNSWIQAYMESHPSQSDTIQLILDYLQTPTQIAYQNPEYVPQALQGAMGGGGVWK